jgi:ABC-type uncharacterized transport system auxiliary subunit
MYYQLQIPAAPAPANYRHPIDVAVGRITGSELLEASPIIYKTKQNQIGTYQYHRWSETPVLMVQEKLIRMLRTSGEYQSVSGMGNPAGGEFVVRGRLYDFTEIDGDGISGLVSLEVELFNRRTAKILWTHFYTGTEPVAGKEVPAVAQALDRNLDRGLKEVMAGLSGYFATNPPGGPQPAASAIAKEN